MGKVMITLYGALAKNIKDKTTELEASTLKEALDALIEKYGEQIGKKIYDETGRLRRFVNIYVNGKDVRFLRNLDTQLSEEDNVSIIPAVGGG